MLNHETKRLIRQLIGLFLKDTSPIQMDGNLNVGGNLDVAGSMTVDGTITGTFSSSGNVLMPDDTWIGLGPATDGKGRIVFDDTPATDEIGILDANVLLSASATIDGMDPSAHAADAAAHHAVVTLGAGSDAALSLIGQELTLANVLTPTEHTAIGNASPHHAPVTVSDTSIGLSGQAIAVSLAASSGLEISSGLKVDMDYAFDWAGLHTFSAGLKVADGQSLAFGATIALSRYADNELGFAAGDGFRVADYAIDSDGYRVTGEGHGYFRYLYATELHAKSFIADLEQALAGGQIITKSVAPLAADFTAPAAGATADLVVQEFQGFGSFHVFVDSDYVRVREFSRAGSSLTIGDCWGTVVYASRDAVAQTQTYTFTRSVAPNAGSMAATTVIPKGSLALDYGATGNGFIESVAQSGAMASGVPYQQIVTWTSHPNSGQTVRTRVGNLNGVYGITDDYFGIGLGDYAGGNYLRYESNGGFILKAGGGVDTIDADGISILVSTATADLRSYRFVDANGDTTARVAGYQDSTYNYIGIKAFSFASKDTHTWLSADAPTGYEAAVFLSATIGAVGSMLKIYVDEYDATRAYCDADNVSFTGGFNVGTATGAGAGDVYGSGELVMTGTGTSSVGGLFTTPAVNITSGSTAVANTTWTDIYTPADSTMGLVEMALLGNGAGGSAYRVVAFYYKDSGGTLTVDAVVSGYTLQVRADSGKIQAYQDSGNPQNVKWSVTGTYK